MESHYFFSFSLRTSFAKIGSHFQLHTKEQLDQQLSAIFFGKFASGGGVTSDSKVMIADFDVQYVFFFERMQGFFEKKIHEKGVPVA